MNILYNKTLLTNAIAIFILIISFFVPVGSLLCQNIAVFALSGSITNWLAIHMLFEKVPFLYGSGVIQIRFTEFKKAIQELVTEQFFNAEESRQFLEKSGHLTLEIMAEKLDYEALYNSLVQAILTSSAGSMLGLLGGEKALEPLKQPIIGRLRHFVQEVAAKTPQINDKNCLKFTEAAEKIIYEKLQQLTPIMVKEIIQNIIKKHLGWLVVWGGVFGGVIGGIATFI